MQEVRDYLIEKGFEVTSGAGLIAKKGTELVRVLEHFIVEYTKGTKVSEYDCADVPAVLAKVKELV